MGLTPPAAASWRIVTASVPCSANSASAASRSRSRKSAISAEDRFLGTQVSFGAWTIRGKSRFHFPSAYVINLQCKRKGRFQEDAMDGSQPINPYLAGNYAPVLGEDDFELVVTGEMPAGLAGAFYRNGPNPQFTPRGEYHWFVGDGMIHGVFVEGGKARYRNRYVRTPKWRIENEAGRALFSGFDPRDVDPSVAGMDGGVANTNIVWHGGRLMALEE